MKNLNSYVHFIGKCGKHNGDLDRIYNFIYNLVEENKWDFSFHRDITDVETITFSGVIFYGADTLEKHTVTGKFINDEFDKKMCVLASDYRTIGGIGFPVYE